ncbi:MAG: hypothetical protein DDT21_02730 [Syntrophomonadaceae bacterium]|nr:hypothetical protein [Bacillota bacterium]
MPRKGLFYGVRGKLMLAFALVAILAMSLVGGYGLLFAIEGLNQTY